MILIGSRAIKFQLNKIKVKSEIFSDERVTNADWDVIFSLEEFYSFCNENKDKIKKMYPSYDNKYHVEVQVNDKKVLYEIELDLEGFTSEYLIKNEEFFTNGKVKDSIGNEYNVMNLNTLYLTKRAHKYYPPHFEKTIHDYHELKKYVNVFNEHEIKYFKMREKETVKRMNEKYKVRNLNMSNDNFFKNPLVEPMQYYEHDDLHETVKHYDKPVYELMKYDFEKAWCERDLFEKLTHEQKIKSVQEEAYVIALERFIIPNNLMAENDLFESYKKSLNKICTTLCSGWFRDFACEHYFEVLNNYEINFYLKFKKAVNDRILLTKKEKMQVA